MSFILQKKPALLYQLHMKFFLLESNDPLRVILNPKKQLASKAANSQSNKGHYFESSQYDKNVCVSAEYHHLTAHQAF